MTHHSVFGWFVAVALCSVGVGGADAVDESPIAFQGAFVPFGLCMENMPPADQVAFSQEVGYTGLGLASLDGEVVKEFSQLPDVVNGTFRIVSALWWVGLDDPIDADGLDGILDDARGMGMAIWMVVDGPDKTNASKSKAVAKLVRVAERCQIKGVQLVLYPHIGTVFETAEEALELYDSLKRRGHPEVRISIHLCHELKAGNRDRIPSIVAKVAPYLALASISGADADTDEKGRDDWASAIMPLDQGTYDPRLFLRALVENHYDGPMELHTYNLKAPTDNDYDQHLEFSLATWKSWVSPPSANSLRGPATKAMHRLAYHFQPGKGWSVRHLPLSAQPRLFRLDGSEIRGIRSAGGEWLYPDRRGGMALLVVQSERTPSSRHLLLGF
jgi:sugar phosphate isomerase/epimerase